MILRDPVHGLVAFEGDYEAVLTRLLATAELQRLRSIRQLGMASLVFPGAEHSRFAHAIGTAYVMTRLLARLLECDDELTPSLRMTPQDCRDAVAAACLHDVGHGPLSHLFEDVLHHSTPHEEWTYRAILDPDADVHRALGLIDPGMPERVVNLLQGNHRLTYLARSISGTLDVDRCDYLLRDSHMTGARYGVYDLDWLIRSLKVVPMEQRAQQTQQGQHAVLGIEGRKGLPPIEGFFLSRHFMYEQVYQHKAIRAAECLVRGIFARLQELVQDGIALDPMPTSIRAMVLGEPVQRSDYFALDDHRFWSCVYEWERSGDAELSSLCGRLRGRVLPKTLPLPAQDDVTDHRLLCERVYERACDVAARNGFRPALHVWLDVASDIPFHEDKSSVDDTLWVVRKHRPLQPLGEVSFVLSQLRNKRVLTHRLIFPAELREQVLDAVDSLLVH
jgi:HD superfamily phosphohydrolase